MLITTVMFWSIIISSYKAEIIYDTIVHITVVQVTLVQYELWALDLVIGRQVSQQKPVPKPAPAKLDTVCIIRMIKKTSDYTTTPLFVSYSVLLLNFPSL